MSINFPVSRVAETLRAGDVEVLEDGSLPFDMATVLGRYGVSGPTFVRVGEEAHLQWHFWIANQKRAGIEDVKNMFLALHRDLGL